MLNKGRERGSLSNIILAALSRLRNGTNLRCLDASAYTWKIVCVSKISGANKNMR